jgi:hypothetical protein
MDAKIEVVRNEEAGTISVSCGDEVTLMSIDEARQEKLAAAIQGYCMGSATHLLQSTFSIP